MHKNNIFQDVLESSRILATLQQLNGLNQYFGNTYSSLLSKRLLSSLPSGEGLYSFTRVRMYVCVYVSVVAPKILIGS